MKKPMFFRTVGSRLALGLAGCLILLAGCAEPPPHPDYPQLDSPIRDATVELDVIETVPLDAPDLGYGALFRFEESEDEIYFVSRRQGTVTVFAEDGTFLRAFGRQGEGPGEFQHLSSIALLEDHSVLALDTKLNKIAHFDADGQLLSDRRLDLLLPDGRHLILVRRSDLILDEDGESFYVLTDLFENDMNREMYTDSLIVSRFNLHGERSASFGRFDPLFLEKISIFQLSNRTLTRSRTGNQLAFVQGATPFVYVHDLDTDEHFKFGRLGDHFRQAEHGIDTDDMRDQRQFIRTYSQTGRVFAFESGWAVVYATPDQVQDYNAFTIARKQYLQVYDKSFNQIGPDILLDPDLFMYISLVDHEGTGYGLRYDDDGVKMVKFNLIVDACELFL